MSNHNKLRLGEIVNGFQPPKPPHNLNLKGAHVSLAPLDKSAHAKELFTAFQASKEGHTWDYLPYGPFSEYNDFSAWLATIEKIADPYYLVIKKNDTNQACGMASYLRIKTITSSIEIGNVNFSSQLQKSVAGTEAMYLMIKWAFEIGGYRRCEWKCHSLNRPSRLASQRLGFSFEGITRQADIVKQRNRDTAWLAIIDKEWPLLKECFGRYLDEDNFTDNGKQKISLRELTQKLLFKIDPSLGRN